MDAERELNLSLTYDEIDLIFNALGSRPFQEVYELIGKINEQVQDQLSDEDQNKKGT